MSARRRRDTTALVASVVLVGTMAIAGCSNDDGGAGAGADTEAEFCAQMAAFAAASDDAGEGELTPEVLAEMRNLAEAAPDGEVRDALEAVMPVIEEIDSLDENDPQAFERIMELVFSPEMTAAADALERAWTEDCGG